MYGNENEINARVLQTVRLDIFPTTGIGANFGNALYHHFRKTLPATSVATNIKNSLFLNRFKISFLSYWSKSP